MGCVTSTMPIWGSSHAQAKHDTAYLRTTLEYFSFSRFRDMKKNTKRNKAVVDITLRPGAPHQVSHFEYKPDWHPLCLADYGQT